MAATDTITFDEALLQRVGQLGRGQLRRLFWASLPQLCNAVAFFLWMFITVDPITSHAWVCSSAADAACQAVWQQEQPSSQAFCALSPQQWRWTSFDSLVAKFNLVCADAWKVQITNSLMFVGALVGSGSFGFMCDRWGRKRPLFLATAIVAAAMFASLAAPSYWVAAALRIMTGIGAAGQSHCIFLLATEPVGPDFRGLASIATLTFFTVGEFLLVGLAFALPAWQHLTLAAAALNTAGLLLYPVVSESGRWLLSTGQTQAAVDSLQRLATANGSLLPSQKLVSSRASQQLGRGGKDADEAAEEGLASASDANGSSEGGTMSMFQILGQRRLALRFVWLLLTWFSLMLNYYGIGLGAGGIPGSIYMTFAVGVVAEVCALLVVGPSVDRIGRNNCVALGQLLGGAACLACAMVQGGTTQAALAAVGKFGCAAAEAVISIYTAELLPTACRSSIMGLCSQASRLGSITAPFLLMAGAQLGSVGGHSQVFIPFLVFGCLAILSGLLVLLMPETLGAAMPETMQDLEQLMSAFTAQPWRQGTAATVTFLFRTKAAVVAAASRASRAASPGSNAPQVQPNPYDPGSSSSSSNAADAAVVLRKLANGLSTGGKADADVTSTDDDRRTSWYGGDGELVAPRAAGVSADPSCGTAQPHVAVECPASASAATPGAQV